MSRPEKSLRPYAAVRRDSDPCFAGAFENAPHSMALVDSDGTMLHVNRALCLMLGYGADELIDSNVSVITHPEDFQTELEQRRHLACADIGRYELIQRYLDKQGETVWVRLSVSAIRRSAQIECFVVEAEAVRPPRLGTADGSQGEWLHRFGDATLSAMHEIGNTLTPLMVNTELIVEQSRSEPVREFAREV
ncbi:MAG TPA: PAS domain S-box protein, partial [Gemmatimonadaceae bacterium]